MRTGRTGGRRSPGSRQATRETGLATRATLHLVPAYERDLANRVARSCTPGTAGEGWGYSQTWPVGDRHRGVDRRNRARSSSSVGQVTEWEHPACVGYI